MCCGSYLACRKAQSVDSIDHGLLLPTASGRELGLLNPFFCWNCGRNPANHLRLVAYPTNYSFFLGIPGLDVRADFWTISSGILVASKWRNHPKSVVCWGNIHDYPVLNQFFWGLWNYQNSPSNFWWEECSVRLAFVKGFGAWSLLLWCRCPWDVGLMGLWMCGTSFRDTL